MASSRVLPCRKHDARVGELLVGEHTELWSTRGEIELIERDWTDRRRDAQTAGQLGGHLNPCGVTGPDAVIDPAPRTGAQEGRRGRTDVIDVAGRHRPICERPHLALRQHDVSQPVEAASPPAPSPVRSECASTEETIDTQHVVWGASAANHSPSSLDVA